MTTEISRRHFLKMAGAVTLGFGALRFLPKQAGAQMIGAGYGPLMSDPQKIFDLPRGFSYSVISRAGEKMADGLRVPSDMDGMGAFPGEGGRTILVRNHELTLAKIEKGSGHDAFPQGWLRGALATNGYDDKSGWPLPGGTTTLIYNPQTREIDTQFLSLSGTLYNCAGGVTPWNSWITCEETHNATGQDGLRAHGFNFEVPATPTPTLRAPQPLRDMGRFRHEAVAVDPNTGAIYQTEDREDGVIYRFWPREKQNLSAGGTLETLKVVGKPSLDARNWDDQTVKIGENLAIEWIPMRGVDSEKDDLRFRANELGATRFARGEGMWFGRDEVFFACTSGGRERKGQIWRLDPRRDTLMLWVQPDDGHLIENADNLTVAPWGDVILSEDLVGKTVDGFNDLVGISPRGEIYKLGRNVLNESELAGCCFSPNGKTLFVNIYSPGLTLAIEGPWKS